MYNVTKGGVFKDIESWIVIIPLFSNSQEPFSKDLINGILQEMLSEYPGFSVSNIVGYWKRNEQTYVDQNHQVIIDAAPDSVNSSAQFFAGLKHDLQRRLEQEKIYVTKQDAHQELLSYDEFFDEIGLMYSGEKNEQTVSETVKQMVSNIDFVRQRMGYETTALRRDTENKKIIWERKLCGIKLRSEIDDTTQPESRLIAADKISDISDVILGDEPFALIGGYEYESYALDKQRGRPLVTESSGFDYDEINTGFLSREGKPLTPKQFVEHFTASVLTNYLVLRDEGFLPGEIRVNVGSDGSMQLGVSNIGTMLLRCPAAIPEENLQKEIMRYLRTAVELNEANALDPISLMQCKAKNAYIFKRAFIHRIIKDKLNGKTHN